MFKIVTISDTHNQLDKVSIPDGDILLHAGDWTNRGSIQECIQFNKHLGEIKDKFKYGIYSTPGNHDWLAQRDPSLCQQILTNTTLVIHNTIEINGIKIFMSPYTPEFNNWAFNVPRGSEIKAKWDQIPEDVDILVTHGPPAGILDSFPVLSTGKESIASVGCEELRKAVERIQPVIHLFGHIHYSHSSTKIGNTLFINASICTEEYKPVNNPLTFEL